MISWLSVLFEAGLATLMVALIIYCIKLNGRLAALRSHSEEINELVAGLREASDRADVSVQRLKAAGLAAERSLRAAIEDAAAEQARLARLAAKQKAAEPVAPASTASRAATPSARPAATAPSAPARAGKAKRDMLMGQVQSSPSTDASLLPERPKTREEAEETLLQAIRSARGGV